MRRRSLLGSLPLLLIALPATSQDVAPTPTTSHRFACCDYVQGKVFLVTPGGKVEWEYPAASSNDLWVLPSGNLLFTTGHGVKEVDRDKKVVFSYESPSEIYACQRLPNGNTFIGECNAGRLIEVTPAGAIAKEIRLLPEGKNGGHAYIRNARRLDNGHYLVCHYGDQKVREYDADGKLLREIAAPGGPHSAARLPNGNTLIACGDATQSAQIFEVDPHDQIVWRIKDQDLPGIRLRFMTGFHRLPNGNTVITNWLGHGHLGEGPHVIEVTPDKKVVWTYADHKTMKTVSSIVVLDGGANEGPVLH